MVKALMEMSEEELFAFAFLCSFEDLTMSGVCHNPAIEGLIYMHVPFETATRLQARWSVLSYGTGTKAFEACKRLISIMPKNKTYYVVNSLGWGIYNREKDKVVMEATSEDYANYLCNLLVNGATEEEIKNRPCPDLEYLSKAN